MALEPGSTLLHYRIVDKLGAGGMGVVWRALDTTLDREVAIKVLPEAVMASEEPRMRFEREAKLLASLSHPNIAEIFGLHADGATRFIAMELLAGEDLATKIGRGRLPEKEVLAIAEQVALALEAAHEQGVIHRDLKPANIQVLPDGRVKVLDFGLAKALGQPEAGGSASLSMSPTLAVGMTAPHTLLGTAAYMSPEQVRGAPLDRRADIWAFGVLLLEMLTGTSPFAGETASDALAAVLTREVELGELPASTPAHVRWIVGRCLERDPRLRLRDIGEARVCLSTGASQGLEAGPGIEGGPATGGRLGIVAGVAIALAAGVAGLWLGTRVTGEGTPSGPRKVDLVLPEQLLFFRQAPPVLAPDGSAALLGSERGLYVRSLDRVENRLIPGTFGAIYATWSPDSREIAFVTPRRLWRATLDGGSPVLIASLPEALSGGGGMVWTRDDRILLAGSSESGLMEVSARGGEVEETVALDLETERDFHEISVLPEERGFLLSVHPQGGIASRIDVLSGGERRIVLDLEGGWVENPVYAPPGFILFSRGSASAPALWAVPFSLSELRATGEPFLVAAVGASPSVSTDGTLCYVRGRRVGLRQPLSLDRRGRIERELASATTGTMFPALSPDGTRLAAAIVDAETYDLVLFDVATRTATRLTSGPGVDFAPAWSPDGTRIAYSIADRDQIAVVAIEAPEEPLVLTAGAAARWHPDGRSIVFQRLEADGVTALRRYWLETGEEEELLASSANERWPTVSPDGRWLAYTSDETGDEEVFVRELAGGDKAQLSRRGGTEPQWTASGELVFRSGSEIHSTRRVEGAKLAFEEPELLFSLADNGLATGEGAYATTSQGGFVVLRSIHSQDAAVLTLVTDWSSEFRLDRRR